jgi:hypothetical protein
MLEVNLRDAAVDFDTAVVLGKQGQFGQGRPSNRRPIQYGTTVEYTLARLNRDRPDLAARVRAGELSANAAAIEAGFRKKPSALEQVLRLLPKLTSEERAVLAGEFRAPGGPKQSRWAF